MKSMKKNLIGRIFIFSWLAALSTFTISAAATETATPKPSTKKPRSAPKSFVSVLTLTVDAKIADEKQKPSVSSSTPSFKSDLIDFVIEQQPIIRFQSKELAVLDQMKISFADNVGSSITAHIPQTVFESVPNKDMYWFSSINPVFEWQDKKTKRSGKAIGAITISMKEFGPTSIPILKMSFAIPSFIQDGQKIKSNRIYRFVLTGHVVKTGK